MKIISKKIRLFFWLINGFIQKQKKALIISIIIGIAFFLAIRFFVPFLGELNIGRKKTRIGLVGNFQSDNLPDEIKEKLSYGLVKTTSDGLYQNKAISSLDVSQDFKNYHIFLKPGLMWSDGSEVESDQIKFNIEGVDISYPSKSEINFSLKEPFAPFLTLLDKPIFRQGLVGFGDFKLKKIEFENQLIKSIDIFNSKEELNYSFYPNLTYIIHAFRLGEIDQFTSIYKNLLDPNIDKLSIAQNEEKNTYLALFFNTDSNSFFADKSIRQAFTYAIKDKSFGNTRCLTSIPKDSFAYSDSVKDYALDSVKANEFVSGIEKDKQKIILSTTEEYLDSAEKIKNDWQEVLGFQVEVKLINVIDDSYQVLLLPQTVPLDPDQYIFWHSQGSANISHFKSPKVDKLLEDGRIQPDLAKRKDYYIDFQKVLSEEVPAVFLFYLRDYTYARN